MSKTLFIFDMRHVLLSFFGKSSKSLVTSSVLSAGLGINESQTFLRFHSPSKGRSVEQDSLFITRRSIDDLAFEPTTSNVSAMPAPPSWTDDKVDLEAARFRSERYKLGPGKIILYNNTLSTYFVECDGKYFLWNEVSAGIDQIKEPAKLEDIVAVLPDASNYKVPDYSKVKLVGLKYQ